MISMEKGKLMSNRALLANALADLGSQATHFENECERFGMTWGCKPDCPVFERGECDLQNENEEMFLRECIE